MSIWLKAVFAAIVAFAMCYCLTPQVKKFAERVGAIDIPNERRINKTPIPRMGGLAIFIGFMGAVFLFADFSAQIAGILLGACVIIGVGALDDIVGLRPRTKLLGQCIAAFVAIRCGVVFNAVTTLSFLSSKAFVETGWYSLPFTFLWIVGCTNAVNLIDGLDGLAVGVSAISSATLLIVSAMVSPDAAIIIIMSSVVGACMGFIPYNHNPAKIFMGDVGSQFLGFILSTASIVGMFKMHALITFFVPVMALAVPLADTAFAFVRRIARGQSPFKADRGHFHHRLLAMGLDQKQAVMVLYAISAAAGLFAVVLTGTSSAVRIICMLLVAAIVIVLWVLYFNRRHKNSYASSRHAVHPSAGETEPPAAAETKQPEQEEELTVDSIINDVNSSYYVNQGSYDYD